MLAELGKGGGTRFWGLECALMFYGIVTAIDGYAELKGVPVPKNHNARHNLVERHHSYHLDLYSGPYGQSLIARYSDAYTMTENEGLGAARCHEVLSRSIQCSEELPLSLCAPLPAPLAWKLRHK